jgi:hypothetical protein
MQRFKNSRADKAVGVATPQIADWLEKLDLGQYAHALPRMTLTLLSCLISRTKTSKKSEWLHSVIVVSCCER